MDKHYQHLSSEERAVIMTERDNGESLRAIGLALNRSVSTIAREVQRNRALHVALALKRPFVYDATAASTAYRSRRRNGVRPRKLEEGTALYQHVHDRLIYWRWSPQQIAARLRGMQRCCSGLRINAMRSPRSRDRAMQAITTVAHAGSIVELIHPLRIYRRSR